MRDTSFKCNDLSPIGAGPFTLRPDPQRFASLICAEASSGAPIVKGRAVGALTVRPTTKFELAPPVTRLGTRSNTLIMMLFPMLTEIAQSTKFQRVQLRLLGNPGYRRVQRPTRQEVK